MRKSAAEFKRNAITRLVRQFGHPRGIPGRVAGQVMAHRRSNRQRNRWAASLLNVGPTDRVLEIGFGPGIAIAELARQAGRVYGIDHSKLMVRQAARRNAAAVRADRVHLVHTSVDDLPSFDHPLDAILAVNSVGFWPDPVGRLRRLRRALRPGGRIALATQPRCPGATTTGAAEQLQYLLTQAGFTHIRVETMDLTPAVVCVLATNPTNGEP